MGHTHRPLTPPQDCPLDPDWKTYNPLHLKHRDHTSSREQAEYVAQIASGDSITMRRTCVAKHTILWELKSIIFPWSYGIDAVHFFTRTSRLGCPTTGLDSILLPPKMVPPMRTGYPRACGRTSSAIRSALSTPQLSETDRTLLSPSGRQLNGRHG